MATAGPAANTRSQVQTTTTTTITTAPIVSRGTMVTTPSLSTRVQPSVASRLKASLTPPSPVSPSVGFTSSLHGWVTLGTSMGLTGTQLLEFVGQQEERQIKRELEERDYQMHLEEKKMLLEMEKIKLEREKNERQHVLEERRLNLGLGASTGVARDGQAEFEKVKLRMPFFDDKDDLESFLGQFERLAKLQRWGSDTWAVRLGTLLKGKAREVYVGMSEHQCEDYEAVKKALMIRFHLNAEAYRRKFRSARRDNTESYGQFVAKLRLWSTRWLELSGRKKDFAGLTDLILLEQLLEGLPVDLSTFIREREPSDVDQAATLAQQYIDARNAWKLQRPVKTNSSGASETHPSGGGNSPTKNKQGSIVNTKKKCYLCHAIGHFKRDCPKKDMIVSKVQAVSVEEVTAFEDDLLQVLVEGKPVQAIRDTGADMICVRADLVPSTCYTGKQVLIQTAVTTGQPQVMQCARVYIDSTYFTGSTEVVAVPALIYPVLLGNRTMLADETVVTLPRLPHRCSITAIQTRAQAKREQLDPSALPLRVVDVFVTPDQVRQYQLTDGKLRHLCALADAKAPPKQQGTGQVQFVWKRHLLYRSYVDRTGVESQQLVVPRELRDKVLQVAHDIPMSGHLGTKKTQDQVWNHFYWTGLCADVKRYCASCDACQRTIPKGKTRRIPLGSMPISTTPFQHVAVDLIGPIIPASARGHRYVLVVIDYATRYPEATPLKTIDTITVAENLWIMWTRVGIPERVLTDRGSQFTSEVMEEVNRLLAIQGCTTSPYHAQCNGAVERFNGTLKTMLRRLCGQFPQEWDRYIPALLFAYREVPHESLGFSPFELLYGRAVRGPLQVLKTLWSNETLPEEERTTAEYVMDLRNRIAETCCVAQRQGDTKALRQKMIKDRTSEDRKFKPNDRVLLLLPTKNNKLELAWRGPYTVLEAVNPYDYKIRVGNHTKLFHANLLRRYIDREPRDGNAGVRVVIVDSEDEPSDLYATAIPLYPLQAEESYRDVVIATTLTEAQQQQVRQFCHDEAAETLTDLPGCTTLDECGLALLDTTPIRIRQYPLPMAKIDIVCKEVKQMLKLGVIEPSNSPYSSPIVLVTKKDGSVRFCIDYRRLNMVLRFDAEPLPDVEYLFSKLSRARYLTKLDLTKGYWQIPMRRVDRAKTAFTTPLGQYQWTVMPFGLKTAGAIFTRMMRILLEPLGRQDVDNFMDDTLIHNESWQEHMEALRAVFRRLQEAHLTVRPKKCYIGFTELTYLGHRVGGGVLKPEMGKVEQIQKAQPPATKKQMRSFLGLTGYYRRFIADYATITAPLTDLLKKGKPEQIQWNDDARQAFSKAKDGLTSSSTLIIPNVQKRFTLQTDASDYGLGAVLMQEEEGVLRPVHYASRKLKPAEQRYATIEKECLAIVWAVAKFEPYLYGQHFVIQSDHQPLQYLQRAKPVSNRLTRWALLLQPYSYQVQMIAGKDNVGADFLSRSEVE